MNFMAIISAIVTFIRFIPDLIKIYKEVQALLNDYEDKKDAKDKAQEIANAVKKARETKDTGALEDIFGTKNVDISFKVEKKSLELENIVSIDDHVEIDSHEDDTYPQDPQGFPQAPPLNIQEASLVIGEDTPTQSVKSFQLFGFMGRSSSEVIGASYVNTTRLGQTTRMGSTFFLFLFLLPFLSGFACTAKPAKNQPNYKPALYAGDSANQGITRKQTGEFIPVESPKFDQFVAMRYSTLSCVYQTYVQNCKEYKQQVVKCQNLDTDQIKEIIEDQK